MRRTGAPLAGLLFALTSGGCVTLAIGSGIAVPPSDAKDGVTPTFTFAPGLVADLPHDVRPSEPDSPRLVRVAVHIGGTLTGLRTEQGVLNAISGPLVLRTDVTFARLGRHDELLFRGTAQFAGTGWGLERDPVGALGTYDVPHPWAWSLFGGGTFEIVTTHRASFLFSLGLGVHTFSGDRVEATTMWGPELHVAMDIDLFKLFGRDEE